MTQNYGNSAGGGRSKRLGVATLSGLLAIGLTPAFANVAFADDPATPAGNKLPAGITISEDGKITVKASAVVTNGNKDEAKKLDKAYKLKFGLDGANCIAAPNTADPLAYKAVEGKDGEYQSGDNVIDFSSFSQTDEKSCVYTISQDNVGGNAPAGWTKDSTDEGDENKFFLSLKAQKKTEGTSSKVVLSDVKLTKGKAADSATEASELKFENKAPWLVKVFTEKGTEADTFPVADNAALGDNTLPTTTPHSHKNLCSDTDKSTVSGWIIKDQKDKGLVKEGNEGTKFSADTELTPVCTTGALKYAITGTKKSRRQRQTPNRRLQTNPRLQDRQHRRYRLPLCAQFAR